MISEKIKEKREMMQSHSRYSAGLTYVYPVISRRAKGVSIGINLNINNACNWQCAYCQVPDLKRGKPDSVDLAVLEKELTDFLDEIVYGDFMKTYVPESARRLSDLAFSGNGEPTSTKEFSEVVNLVAQLKERYPEIKEIPVRVITNGSFMGKPSVLDAVKRLSALRGEIWFKVDAIDRGLQEKINGVSQSAEAILVRVSACAERCPTWLQSCFFKWDGRLPQEGDIEAYRQFCEKAKQAGIRGVYLYTIARQPMLPQGIHLSPLTAEEMEHIAQKIRALGLSVTVSI